MLRRAFLASTGAALVALPRVASATGGQDVEGAIALHQMRVLLASGAFPVAEQLDGWHFGWNGRTYRGTFATVRLADGRSGLVNTVPLDAYLYGVLSAEVSAVWPRPAQEAQAIVSRTYALGRLRPGHPYDVVGSESDQRYGGIESETVEGRVAVDATAGTIVSFDDLPAQVAYSSCCGGHTANAADVWRGAKGLTYLAGVDDPHCAGTPEYRWTRTLDYQVFAHVLDAQLAEIGEILSCSLEDADASGRPRRVALNGRRSRVDVAVAQFRNMLGTTVVRSTWLREVDVARGDVVIAGNGRGHGVGLCQWGARVMGVSGSAASEIVQFYFPGTAFGRG